MGFFPVIIYLRLFVESSTVFLLVTFQNRGP